MKFRWIIQGEYEVKDEDMEYIYGTTDPFEAAAIESTNRPEYVFTIIGEKSEKKLTIEPIIKEDLSGTS